MEKFWIEELCKRLEKLDCTLYDVQGNPILLPDGSRREITNRRLAVDFLRELLLSSYFNEDCGFTRRQISRLIFSIEMISQDCESYASEIEKIIYILYACTDLMFSLWTVGEFDVKVPLLDYELDSKEGICDDCKGNFANIRLVRNNDKKIMMKKIGRLISDELNKILLVTPTMQKAINRYCEIVTDKWAIYHQKYSGVNTTLRVDDDFRFIYDSDNYNLNFDSCMQDKDCYQFYNDIYCDCKAVSLLNAEGLILARSIIFNDVEDEDGNRYRMLERIYGTHEKDRKILLEKVIEQGLIDCHKAFNASCSDCKNIVGVGDFAYVDFTKKELSIDVNGIDYDFVPYLDTFKYFRIDNMRCSNDSYEDYDKSLTCTDGYIEVYVCDCCGAETIDESDSYYCDLNGCNYCTNCCVYSDYHSTYIPKYSAVEFYDRDGDTDYYHPDYATPDCVEVDGELYEIGNDDIVYDEINDEYIFVDDSVEYYDADLCVRLTHTDAINQSIFEVDGKYYHEDLLKYDEINEQYILAK